MEEKELDYKNLTCCSLELSWKDRNKEKGANDPYEYNLYKKEEKQNILIYSGKDTRFEVINLKPNKSYIFKLKIIKSKKYIEKIKVQITTLKGPTAILSENSDQIAIGKKIDLTDNIIDSQIKIINNCSKLIFEENDINSIKGVFDGIEIKITNIIENNMNTSYISFDIEPNYFENYFNQFIDECENDIMIPFHFVIKKLPTILIIDLLKSGPVILTGKRMGGVIASSLAFYILYIGQSKLTEINYGNPFDTTEKNCIGVVTFGSPLFLNNLTTGIKMKEFAPYFINIKEEFDFIPEIIDCINKNKKYYKEFLNIFQKNEFNDSDLNLMKNYLLNNNLTINDTNKIPFGNYFKMETLNNSLIKVNEYSFKKFYNYIANDSVNSISNKILYRKLSEHSDNNFNKINLEYLGRKDFQLDHVKIIRRIKEPESESHSIKGIIKLKLPLNEHNFIPPDIINKITLISDNKKYEINENDIYYDNSADMTAYVDNLNENINEVIISNIFFGEMRVKNIINIQGSGATRKMLEKNLEKLFLIPFFKLIEILYSSKDNEGKSQQTYEELKKENFGNNFEDLKILKPFEKQIKILNELLFFSRPDILGKFEKEFINKYVKLNAEQMNYFNQKLEIFYKQALQIQNIEKINCLDSEPDSIAKKVSFPQNFKEDKRIRKIFMCRNATFKNKDFITEKYDDPYIKVFFIQNLIKEVLQSLENIIKDNKKNHNKKGDYKEYLNKNIGKFYEEQIIPNVYFILVIILSSIESGDGIIFNHIIDKEKITSAIFYPFIWMKPLGENRARYERDFKKIFSKEEIERLNILNLFYKTKKKKIVDSNFSPIENEINNNTLTKKSEKKEDSGDDNTLIKRSRTYQFSKYSEYKIFGEKYYENFLNILNYSNDFPEDVEISIYDNFKEENKYGDLNISIVKEMICYLIKDIESAKGFLSLLRQSYLLGKLRTDIVSLIYF